VALYSARGPVAEDRTCLIGRGVAHVGRCLLVLGQVGCGEPPTIHRAAGQRHEGDHTECLDRPGLLALLVLSG